MITYRYEQEKAILEHYAAEFSDEKMLKILASGNVSGSSEALHLSEFFWKVVDSLVSDAEHGKSVCGENNLEEWSELIMASLRSYLRNNGYEKEWDEASDDA